jgi:cobyrinic acid a,c-diamide synthase
MKAVLIAGTTSGVGKTTIATGLMGALCRRGITVQPFKTGPDYIDPGYHNKVTGEISRNLDTWMLSPESIIELYNRAAGVKDIAVIEGVMGLYDGRNATSDEGSTAQLAKLLKVPVLLVVDAKKGARSIAAMVKGYKDFDPELNICGVILNNIGSSRHLQILIEAIEHYTGLSVAGHLPRQDSLSLPERYLGLIPTVEEPAESRFFNELVDICDTYLNIPEIMKIAERAQVPRVEPQLFPEEPLPKVARIGIARDKAFSFYYQDNLDLLESRGAELVFFSSLDATDLPAGISGLYIGGGFPELYAAGLAANKALRESIKKAVRQGMPVYAECGGLMYMGESIKDLEGQEYPMVGAIPVRSNIKSTGLNLGYRTVKALGDGPLLKKGETVRGHEFHWSVLATGIEKANAYEIEGRQKTEGFLSGNMLCSYIHLHMAARPAMIDRFISLCSRFGGKLKGSPEAVR